jgi:hypothetical protein
VSAQTLRRLTPPTGIVTRPPRHGYGRPVAGQAGDAPTEPKETITIPTGLSVVAGRPAPHAANPLAIRRADGLHLVGSQWHARDGAADRRRPDPPREIRRHPAGGPIVPAYRPDATGTASLRPDRRQSALRQSRWSRVSDARREASDLRRKRATAFEARMAAPGGR